MGWVVLIVVIVVVVVVIFATSKSAAPSNSNRTSPHSQAESQWERGTSSQNSPLSQTGTEQIKWRDIDVPSGETQIGWVDVKSDRSAVASDGEPAIDYNFLNQNVPDDLDNILTNIIGSRDQYSQEIFRPGERVYLCRRHRLAYHEDSWREMGGKCSDCGNNEHTGFYDLPFSVDFEEIIRNRPNEK